MSLWFTPPPSTSSPSESRQLGFGQIPSMGSSFTKNAPEEDSPMSAAAGGITQNFSSRVSLTNNLNNEFNFDGPHFYNNSLTYSNTINNNIMQNFNVNNLFQIVENITNVLGGGEGFSGGAYGSVFVLTGLTLSGSGLVATRSRLNFSNGVLTGIDTASDVTVSTTTCPP